MPSPLKNHTSTPVPPVDSDAERLSRLEHDLKEQLALTRDLVGRISAIQRYIFWQKTFFWVKLLLIVVPIVLGILYLPPLIQQALQPYQELLKGGQGFNLEGLYEF